MVVSEGMLQVTAPDDETYRMKAENETEENYGGNAQEDEEEEEEITCDGAMVLRRGGGPEEAPSFGNISVMNSSDVHFGTKTFYQGPVTIKQFLYANGSGKVKSDDSEGDDEETVKVKKSEVVVDPAKLPTNGGLDNPSFVADIVSDAKCNGLNSVKPGAEENNSRPTKAHLRDRAEKLYCLITLLAIGIMASVAIVMVTIVFKHSPEPVGQSSASQTVPKGDSDEQDVVKPVDAPLDPSINLTLSGKLKLVSRLEWLAQPATSESAPLKTPVPYVIIHHTATENCSSQAQCIFHVRYIQMFHIESRNWWDIGYNFLVGGDGEAYEGRGWTAEGAHSYGYNSKSIGIAFIGTFNAFKPPQIQIVACRQLIERGVELGYISKDYKLLAQRQLQTSQSPGAELYEDMKTWPHWSPEP